MKKSLWLVFVSLLIASLASVSCTQNTREVPTSSTPVTESTTIPAIPTGPLTSSTSPLTPATSSTAVSLISDDTWGHWGLNSWPDEYKVTSGASLDFIEKEKTTTNGSPAIIYYVSASGLPVDQVYHIWIKSLLNTIPTELSYSMKIDESGYLETSEGRFQLGFLAPAKGESMELALMTSDKTGGAFGKIIPYPIESQMGPYRLWAELYTKTGDMFRIYGEGFLPEEEIEFTSTSEGETAKGKINTDDNGRFSAVILPAVVGEESGSANYSVKGKNGEISVSY